MSEMDREQHIATEDLSAFVDGQITDPAERARIEQHLASCPACREEVEELRAISQLLADLPAPEVPRSFRLSPDDIPQPAEPDRLAPEPTPIQPWIVRHQATFRYAAMAAALLLALIVTIDLLPESGGDEAADGPVAMMDEADQESAPSDDSDAGSAGMDEEAAQESAPQEDAPEGATDQEAAEEGLEQDESASDGGADQDMADDAVTSEEDDEASEPESAGEADEDAEMGAAEDSDESEDDVGTFGDESVEEETEESADAPESDRGEDSTAMSGAPDQDDSQALEETAAEDEASGGASTLRLVALGLGVVTALLVIIGFVVPRLWRSSTSNR